MDFETKSQYYELFNVKDYLMNLFFHLILKFNLGIKHEYRNIFAIVLFNAANRSCFFIFNINKTERDLFEQVGGWGRT